MRIIGGAARGQKLQSPKGRATRPTTDRVREALFSLLESYYGGSWEGLRVLDLFAGSGALGLEALSRGAQHVDFVEQSASCKRIIRANAARLGFRGECAIYQKSVKSALELLKKNDKAYHLVLADPPYANEPHDVLAKLGGGELVEPQGLVVLEHTRTFCPSESYNTLAIKKQKRYGDTRLSIYHCLKLKCALDEGNIIQRETQEE